MFFGKKLIKSENQKAAEALPYTKKVQYLPQDFGEVKTAASDDPSVILTLEPVNYYADKYKYILCTFYYDDSFENVFFSLEFCVNDRPADRSEFFKADFELMRSAMRKFGQNLVKNA